MTLPHPPRTERRSAVAAVEFAFVLPFLLMVIVGVWELGRVISVMQIMQLAGRDAARISAQGSIVNTNGAYTQIRYDTGTPNVKDTVLDYLYGNGITNLAGVTVTFSFVEGDLSRQHPYQGLKNERFKVKIVIPYANVRWSSWKMFAPETISVEVFWSMLVDDPFTVGTTLPGWSPP